MRLNPFREEEEEEEMYEMYSTEELYEKLKSMDNEVDIRNFINGILWSNLEDIAMFDELYLYADVGLTEILNIYEEVKTEVILRKLSNYTDNLRKKVIEILKEVMSVDEIISYIEMAKEQGLITERVANELKEIATEGEIYTNPEITIPKTETETVYEVKKKMWESDLNVINASEIVVEVEEDVLKILRTIAKKLDGHEFSILFKVDGNRILSEYYIPEQEVTTGTVVLKENVAPKKEEGFKCIIHYHPMNLRTFSGTDETYVNRNFDISLLFCSGEITDARMRFKLENGDYLVIKPKVEVIEHSIEIDEEQLQKIKKKTFIPTETKFKYGRYGNYYDII